MKQAALADTASVDYIDLHPPRQDSIAEVLHGLRQPQKTLSPKYFYDERGSQLFESITLQPEYYPTRTERRILEQNRDAIAHCLGEDITLIEPGCGSCEKVRLLLEHVDTRRYVAMDISSRFLLNAANRLAGEFPDLDITAVCADFSQLAELSGALDDSRRILFYPGSTLGNFTPEAALGFLKNARSLAGPQGGLLIGVDRHKDAETLNAAYNDASGVTADFNRNALLHLNRILPADFDPQRFTHQAFYNEQARRIEMHLRSEEAQTVSCAGHDIHFAAGETLHSENSYKYTEEDFATLAEQAGFHLRQLWRDQEALFCVYYCEAA